MPCSWTSAQPVFIRLYYDQGRSVKGNVRRDSSSHIASSLNGSTSLHQTSTATCLALAIMSHGHDCALSAVTEHNQGSKGPSMCSNPILLPGAPMTLCSHLFRRRWSANHHANSANWHPQWLSGVTLWACWKVLSVGNVIAKARGDPPSEL